MSFQVLDYDAMIRELVRLKRQFAVLLTVECDDGAEAAALAGLLPDLDAAVDAGQALAACIELERAALLFFPDEAAARALFEALPACGGPAYMACLFDPDGGEVVGEKGSHDCDHDHHH